MLIRKRCILLELDGDKKNSPFAWGADILDIRYFRRD